MRGSVESINPLDNGFELAIRLENTTDRTIHYIADVRGLIFDAATGRLRVQLSDKGRRLPPGGIAVLPRLRMVEPHSQAVVTVRLPRTIVKLTAAPSATGEPTFEEHALADASDIDVEIGWADTPYYSDTRERSRQAPPIASWEQQTVRMSGAGPARRGKAQ